MFQKILKKNNMKILILLFISLLTSTSFSSNYVTIKDEILLYNNGIIAINLVIINDSFEELYFVNNHWIIEYSENSNIIYRSDDSTYLNRIYFINDNVPKINNSVNSNIINTFYTENIRTIKPNDSLKLELNIMNNNSNYTSLVRCNKMYLKLLMFKSIDDNVINSKVKNILELHPDLYSGYILSNTKPMIVNDSNCFFINKIFNVSDKLKFIKDN